MVIINGRGLIFSITGNTPDVVQEVLIALSILVVICALAFAGYILLRNNKNPKSEDQLNLGNFIFVFKDAPRPVKSPEAQPLGEDETDKPAAMQPPEEIEAAKPAAVPAASAAVKISNMKIEPEKAKPGELVTIWFSATNLDSPQIRHEITLKIDDRVFNTRMISILPGAMLHLNFKVAITEPGTYTADVNGVSGVFTIGQ
jgi:hypothetical protein